MKTIRVFIVCGRRLYGEGLAQALGSDGRIDVLGSNAEASASVAYVRKLLPDMVLIDMALEGCCSAIRAIREAAPKTEIVALAVSDLESDVLECAEAGVSGYVTRSGSLDDLIATIERVNRGEVVCSPRVTATLFRRVGALAAEGSPLPTLTPRELEIMELIEQGQSNKEIAQRLFITVPTVKNHIHNIFEKLGVHRRTEAVARIRSYPPPESSNGPAA